MEPHIRAWDGWMRALGDFYDYRDTDGVGRVYEVHRRSIHPAMRVCREWGSLLLNDKTQVACEAQECTNWLASFFSRTGFLASAQECVVRAFGLGTGAWALWVDAGSREVRVRRYDARMAIQALFRMGRRARFDIDEFDSPNGSYLASRPHDRVVFSPLLSIAGRLSADCFVRNPCGRRCRQTAFETCPHRRRPLHCRGGCRLGDCLVGRQLTCMDEPGNYLDIKSAEALEQMMSAYAGTIVFVSHDKRLVENVADIIYEIKDTKLVKIFQRE